MRNAQASCSKGRTGGPISAMAEREPAKETRATITRMQDDKLRVLLAEILPANAFYRQKLAKVGLDAGQVKSLSDLSRLPFTTKEELQQDQSLHPPYGGVLTYPLDRYSRFHQTSGSLGKPLRWLDTPAS